ncbi:bifunctional histidinol-phosphatase/imidazoleglycerol-phosphate dehydratase HisB [Buchnera aphidicola]|uniref:Imidazoleglycerol-phosphate dehydratase n=1 Tax=Buchnera aphidicola (Therioaphis trifolii) TaxID=1241884 RepID=A0A4D6YM84_9GAMM|nr:bifunctional histidinol-phosphatase/imidazoleglycerol-phosphate dehydratase HisB [Buchnera aphidicola]QCI27084.1 bifunctional histidinol-phosphatase/imidazoleglycerol-phosphate dehydratase HisB [Buchnera aphidicola (Therioaphis trifolii)]
MQEKILFIDRDGTLIHEPTDNLQVDKIEKLIFEPFVILTLKKLIALNFKLVMVTNQDGLYTETFSYNSFIVPHKCMVDVFYSQGIFFEHILICPHFLKDNCNCRKPKTELVDSWIIRNSLDKKNSYVIGDRETDLELANNMGISGILYNKYYTNWNHIYNIIAKKNRYFKKIRNTLETKIKVELWLDQVGKNTINTGIYFFNHMLDQIAIHSNIVMNIFVKGDIEVDDHHIIEDTGIVLGHVILKCLGNKLGINRFGFHVPMDESSAYCLLDFSGRSYLKFISKFNRQFVGDFNTDMVEHFFRSLSYSMKSTIHLISMGLNDHHKIEALFKSFGKALGKAIKISSNILPTSKGIL